MGINKGEYHGKLDEATIAAIKACQKACGVPVTGKMDKGTCGVIDKALKEKGRVSNSPASIFDYILW